MSERERAIARLAEYWKFNKTGQTPNGIVSAVARESYEAGHNAAIEAVAQMVETEAEKFSSLFDVATKIRALKEAE